MGKQIKYDFKTKEDVTWHCKLDEDNLNKWLLSVMIPKQNKYIQEFYELYGGVIEKEELFWKLYISNPQFIYEGESQRLEFELGRLIEGNKK